MRLGFFFNLRVDVIYRNAYMFMDLLN